MASGRLLAGSYVPKYPEPPISIPKIGLKATRPTAALPLLLSSPSSTVDARQRVSTVDDGLDNNNGKAAVGRVAFSPILGIEIGGSGYFGTYDPASKRPLAIWAADWTFQRGPFELIGEAAWVYARDNHRTLTGGFAVDANGRPLPRRMDGYYVQGNYHFMPEVLRRWAPTYFTEA